MNLTAYLRRNRYQTPVAIIALVLCGFVSLNLPYDRVQRRVWAGRAIDNQDPAELESLRRNFNSPIGYDGWESDLALGRHAGWPQSFRVDPTDARTASALLAAIQNNLKSLAVLTVILVGLVLCGHWILLVNIRTIRKQFRWRSAVAGALVLLTFTGSTVGCHRIVASHSNPERQIADCGVLGYSTNLPWLIATMLPTAATQPFLNIDSAMAESLRPELLSHLSSEPSLSRLHLRECIVNRTQWQRLIGSGTMRRLRFENCHFEPSLPFNGTVDWHAKELILENCTGLENISADLCHANRLESLEIVALPDDIHRALLMLSRGSLTELTLKIEDGPSMSGLAVDGKHYSPPKIHVDGFDHLRRVTIHGRQSHESSEARLVNISNCQQLQEIAVDQSHWWDLEFSELPLLTTLRATAGISSYSYAADLPTIRKLSMSHLPRLQKLSLHSAELVELNVTSCDALRELRLCPDRDGSWEQSRHAEAHCESLRSHSTKLSDRLSKLLSNQPWLQQLTELDLSYNRLTDCDLTTLLQLPRLRSLILNHTDVSVPQLTMGGVNESVQFLSLHRETITSDELNVVLDHFPVARTVRIGDVELDRLELSNRPELEALYLGPEIRANAVEIINCAKLSNYLRISKPLRSLHIKGAPALEGLYVEQPAPADLVLEGLRQIKEVTLRGKNVSDAHFKELSMCHQLNALDLSGANISTECLKQIRTMNRLESLELQGTDVDDSVVFAWGRLENLFVLDLSDTLITSRSLPQIAQYCSLQRIALRNVSIDPGRVGELCSLSGLYDLDVAGVGISSDSLGRLLQQIKLDRLDLSRTQLDALSVQVLCGHAGKRVMCLELNHCKLETIGLERIVDAHPHLMIVTEDRTVSASTRLRDS